MIVATTDSQGFNWWVLIAFAGLVAILVGLHRVYARWEQRRQQALPLVAKRLGLSFYAGPDADLAFQWCMIDDALFRGDNRYAENILSGSLGGYPVVAFDHHHEAQGSKRERHHIHQSVLILTLPRGLKSVEILPDGLKARFSQPLGTTDIDLESAEFSRAYCIRAHNKRLAYDVCNPEVMAYLLAHRGLHLRIKTNALFVLTDLQAAEEIEINLRHLVEIRSRLPEYLFNNV